MITNILTREGISHNEAEKRVLFERVEKCSNEIGGVDKKACIESEVVNITREYGANTALDLVKKLANESSFASSCHGIVHRIGEEGYILLTNGEKIKISDSLGVCGSGFYHALMMEIVSHERDLPLAKNFCDDLKKKLGKEGLKENGQCYHGIGHGLTYLYAQDFWEDEAPLVKKSLQDCEMYLDSNEDCISGVFGGVSGLYYGLHSYWFDVDEKDPLWVCRRQKDEYKHLCYQELMPALSFLTGYDFSKAVPFVEGIEDDKSAKKAMDYLSTLVAQDYLEDKISDYEALELCRGVQDRLQSDCLGGLVKMIARSGAFEVVLERSLAFCNQDLLTEKEREVCYENMVSQLEDTYPSKAKVALCNSGEHQYPSQCR